MRWAVEEQYPDGGGREVLEAELPYEARQFARHQVQVARKPVEACSGGPRGELETRAASENAIRVGAGRTVDPEEHDALEEADDEQREARDGRVDQREHVDPVLRA